MTNTTRIRRFVAGAMAASSIMALSAAPASAKLDPVGCQHWSCQDAGVFCLMVPVYDDVAKGQYSHGEPAYESVCRAALGPLLP